MEQSRRQLAAMILGVALAACTRTDPPTPSIAPVPSPAAIANRITV